ncbi:MAG: hypothetical protein RL669_796 [Pseudomonadota bacterium]
MSALLQVHGLQAGYGASQVLFGVDLEVREGEVATLLGRNGMGKSTTVRAILGLTPPSGGSIVFAGQRIDGLAPERIARLGLALVPESRRIFRTLSVEENLLAFARPAADGTMRWSVAEVYATFPALAARARHRGDQLSGGEQQMLAIGRALMTHPRLLILDEATEGLAPLVREEIWRCLALLRSRGQAILVIDKYVRRLLALADSHTLLERGRVVWSGSSRALAADEELWQRTVGV